MRPRSCPPAGGPELAGRCTEPIGVLQLLVLTVDLRNFPEAGASRQDVRTGDVRGAGEPAAPERLDLDLPA
jgi:hypothetical protein